jgi:predicted restriction endonuclease
MARDGRCAVTRCRTAEVLEAAHLIPYASNDPERDKPENGILLRADIHTLLDRHLVAINPETMSLWVSSRLHETAYAGINGKKIRTGAGLERLRHQYEAAMRRDRGEPPYG